MSYELRHQETLDGGMHRIIGRQIENAIAASRESDGETSPVHETRKHLKKARAAMRMIAKRWRAATCDGRFAVSAMWLE